MKFLKNTCPFFNHSITKKKVVADFVPDDVWDEICHYQK